MIIFIKNLIVRQNFNNKNNLATTKEKNFLQSSNYNNPPNSYMTSIIKNLLCSKTLKPNLFNIIGND